MSKTKNIAIIPTSEYYSNNKLFNLDFNIDNRILGYIKLKAHLEEDNWTVNTFDMFKNISDIDIVFFERLDFILLRQFIINNPNAKRIYVPWEPEVVSKSHSIKKLKKISEYFDFVLTWNDDLVDNVKFLKINYAHHLSLSYSHFPNLEEFRKRKFLVQVSSNLKSSHPKELYSLRKQLNHYAEKKFGDDYSYYGSKWKTKNKAYKGIAEDKTETISQYRFSFCLENMRNVNGYITEKIFDCFIAGVVPIYYGASNITEYIPKSTFIDLNEFQNPQELFDYLHSIDFDSWIDYLNEAKQFLISEKAHKFSYEYFIQRIASVMQMDSNRQTISNTSKLWIEFKYIIQIFRIWLRLIKRRLVSN